MKVTAIKTSLFKEGQNLDDFINSHIKKIKDGSVIVITSKIVSLSEGRFIKAKTKRDKEEIIKSESDLAILTKYAWLTLKDGALLASAGVDESNGNGKIILLPRDSFQTTKAIREKLLKKHRLKNLGVIITDSRSTILRSGSIGVAIGYAGFKGAEYYRGKKDIFGRRFKYSKVDHANALAGSAVLEMGEGDEMKPLAIIEEAPITFTDRMNRRELFINLADDMYLPYINKFVKMKNNEKRK